MSDIDVECAVVGGRWLVTAEIEGEFVALELPEDYNPRDDQGKAAVEAVCAYLNTKAPA